MELGSSDIVRCKEPTTLSIDVELELDDCSRIVVFTGAVEEVLCMCYSFPRYGERGRSV